MVDSGAHKDVKVQIKNVNGILVRELYPFLEEEITLIKNKIRIFNCDVKTVLLYGCKTWEVISQITNKLQTFVNGFLSRI
jgi:hypothetical protein